LTIEFKLPDVGEGVVEGEIVKWLVKEGDTVNEDQLLVEVLTDKATIQIPSPAKGKVLKLLAKEGAIVKVGESLIIIGEEGESGQTLISKEEPASEKPDSPSQPAPTEIPRSDGGQVMAPPAIRKLARDMNVDLAGISGTGPSGRITREDVLQASKGGTQSAVVVTETKVRPAAGTEERIPLHGIRRIIAERMVKSRRTAAHVTHVDEVDMTELVALRQKMKSEAEATGVKLTYLPFIVKAVVKALKDHPYLNSSLDDEKSEIVLKKYYNIGIAAAAPDGLVVPIVKNADQKSVMQVAREIETLSEKARTGKLELNELQGGTFTITNIGPLGGVLSTPIINYPEVAIMGVHKITPKPVVRNGEVLIREMTYLSLSFDHRVLDGAEAALFTNDVIKYLQNPQLLLTESLA
jgi:pyruvate dehydrogenase E2 component (dihydrolipoyllysine-residue acetyltransferase)